MLSNLANAFSRRRPGAVPSSIGTIKPPTQDSSRSGRRRRGEAEMTRILVIAIAVLVGSALDSARAQNGPWCAFLTGGSPNCAFATFAECIKAIKGKTAICDRNAEYAAPAEADSDSHANATPNPAVTGSAGGEGGEARAHQSRHRSVHHLRSRTTPRTGKRHRLNPYRNQRR